ncbi:MAG TPA: hypothetical protein VFU27_08875 [Terriglobales bacterium]|nr:hypothetical protein [Terriglobales bacterium]
MDCNQFTNVLDELERESLMPAGMRGLALQHAESCSHCRARLAVARLLSLELRALARDDEQLSPPARVEAALLAAFREKSRRRARVWRGLGWAGAAASVALAAGLLSSRIMRRSAPLSPPAIQAAQPAPVPQPSSAAPLMKQLVVAGARSASPPRSRAAHARAAVGSAADFIALSPWATSYPVGDAMVVRVQVPRSAPALVGLPLGGGDMSGTVTADVVLGQDGIARAIRFLPPGESGAANPSFSLTQNQ